MHTRIYQNDILFGALAAIMLRLVLESPIVGLIGSGAILAVILLPGFRVGRAYDALQERLALAAFLSAARIVLAAFPRRQRLVRRAAV